MHTHYGYSYDDEPLMVIHDHPTDHLTEPLRHEHPTLFLVTYDDSYFVPPVVGFS